MPKTALIIRLLSYCLPLCLSTLADDRNVRLELQQHKGDATECGSGGPPLSTSFHSCNISDLSLKIKKNPAVKPGPDGIELEPSIVPIISGIAA